MGKRLESFVVRVGITLGLFGVYFLIALAGAFWFRNAEKDVPLVELEGVAVVDAPAPGLDESFWFMIVTMTTVGYGDFAPRTASGKSDCVFIVIGALIYVLFAGSVFDALWDENQRENCLQKLFFCGTSLKKNLAKHIIVLLSVFVFGMFYFAAEDDSLDDAERFGFGAYYSIVTISTVGYGDISKWDLTDTKQQIVVILWLLLGWYSGGQFLSNLYSYTKAKISKGQKNPDPNARFSLLFRTILKPRKNAVDKISQFLFAVCCFLIVASIGAAWFSAVEPGYDFSNSFYFMVTTMTTIGYGDITPETPGGRVCACVIICSSLCLIACLANLVDDIFDRGEKRKYFQSGAIFFVLILVMCVLGGVLWGSYLDDSNGSGIGFANGLYFSVITVTTVGYGDYDLGQAFRTNDSFGWKAVSIAYMLLGWFCFLQFVGNMWAATNSFVVKRTRAKLNNYIGEELSSVGNDFSPFTSNTPSSQPIYKQNPLSKQQRSPMAPLQPQTSAASITLDEINSFI